MFPSNLMAAHVGQRGGKLSPRLWQRLVESTLTPDGSAPGSLHVEDFDSFPNVTATTAAGQLQPINGYHAYIEADATPGGVKQLAGENSSVQILTSTDTADGDNHDTILGTNGNVGSLGSIDSSAPKLLVCEARVRFANVSNGSGSFFFGLAQEGRAIANGLILDSGGHAIANIDAIGFLITEDDNDKLKFVYRKNGQAVKEVLEFDGVTADTWHNLGFIYDPVAPASEKIKIFVNNLEQSTKISADAMSAADFPDGENLAMYAGLKNSANNDPQHVDLDIWGFYQAGE